MRVREPGRPSRTPIGLLAIMGTTMRTWASRPAEAEPFLRRAVEVSDTPRTRVESLRTLAATYA